MARSFNGSSDLIDAGTASSVGTTHVWSASSWIYASSLPSSGNFTCILAKRSTAVQAEYEIFIENVAGTTGFGAFNGTTFKAFGTLTTNTWYQCVAACDATSFIAYIGGTLAGTDTNDYRSGGGSANPVCIGADFTAHPSAQEFFNGRIADVALWNVKLSAGDAAALGAGARPYQIRPANLIGWWPVDGLQSPEPDLSGHAANGTLTGTALAPGPPYMPFTPRWPQFQLPPLPIFTLMPQIVT